MDLSSIHRRRTEKEEAVGVVAMETLTSVSSITDDDGIIGVSSSSISGGSPTNNLDKNHVEEESLLMQELPENLKYQDRKKRPRESLLPPFLHQVSDIGVDVPELEKSDDKNFNGAVTNDDDDGGDATPPSEKMAKKIASEVAAVDIPAASAEANCLEYDDDIHRNGNAVKVSSPEPWRSPPPIGFEPTIGMRIRKEFDGYFYYGTIQSGPELVQSAEVNGNGGAITLW